MKRLHAFYSWFRTRIVPHFHFLLPIFFKVAHHIVRTRPRRILFLTSRGDYQCNPKWICEELLRRGTKAELIWCTRPSPARGVPPAREFPPQLKLVWRRTLGFYYALLTSRIIVDNSVSYAYVGYTKKKGQTVIETWHGAIGIKRFSKDQIKEPRWLRSAEQVGRETDYLLSNSTLEDAIYREDYWKFTPILHTGHARNDILCEGNSPRALGLKAKIRALYGLDTATRICLYAPTFRDGALSSDLGLDFVRLKQALERRFGGTWTIWLRLHFVTMQKLAQVGIPKGVTDVGAYPDIQELLTCVDVGITDYSSWICEYLLTRRPGFLYAPDLDDYQKTQRAFYYPLTELPYPLARTNDELEKAILGFNETDFPDACTAFLKAKGCIDDGHAAERAATLIENILDGTPPNGICT